MRFGDMPETGGNMMCSECGQGPYSANRGDYFLLPDDEIVYCVCGGEMALGVEKRYWVFVEGGMDDATT